MKSKLVGSLVVVLMGMLLSVPMCWAKEKAYNYVVAYSFKTKIVYYTPTFMLKVDGVSYNNEEYVSDTETILEMESAFQDFMEKELKLDREEYTVSARMAYKTEEIAKAKLEKEVGDFRFKGFKVNEVSKFKFK
ncbi:MAG: hypothetical protein M0036_12570 [Desulfobacteraceae bacterium]|nr:hypothetical protein [Desulfobacteraceae bacterium]